MAVLIVDDDRALLEVLTETLRLRLADVSVESCDSAGDALARIAETEYDAIVADIRMPGMDGLELLARVRELKPETPILLITGHGEHDLAVRALRNGAHDYILKPIDREYFVGSLSHAIEAHRVARQVAQQAQQLEEQARDLRQRLEHRTRELRLLYDREATARAELASANQELERAQRRREELVAMVAHDLGAPLATLRAYVELLAQSVSTAAQDRARSIVDSETRRMERLVNDLASSSDAPTGRFELEVAKADLAAIARQQAELAGILSELHSITVEAPKRLTLACDPDRIAQVFANLLTNAIRHTSGGAIVVRVWSEDRHARVSIHDAGKRLPAGRLQSIFESSSGLGLSIARAIVEAHGGRIWAERAPSKGTAFQFSLPLSKRQPKRGGAVQRPQRPGVNAARQN